MAEDWAQRVADGLFDGGLMKKGICLILGAADTGKTTLAFALAKRSAANSPVGIVDADIGQSHIGAPGTVGWTIIDNPQIDLSQVEPDDISFVGDISPVGHLLQFTAAVAQGVRQVRDKVGLVIIDTPGFVIGPAASALWWTVQRILQPHLIAAVERENELARVLAGLRSFETHIELIKCPPDMPLKSPQHRKNYRRERFMDYFQDARLYNLKLGGLAVQGTRNLTRAAMINRLVALRDSRGIDSVLAVVADWRLDEGLAVIKAPVVDIEKVRCLVIGDVGLDIDV
jgi:polynucleotide 5'-hydroxyl-kinase GRC3/NOL9